MLWPGRALPVALAAFRGGTPRLRAAGRSRLLIATILHLRSGATADFTHGLAAAYIGFSLAFGHSLIRWADARFAHRFAAGPPPPRPPKSGRARTHHEWREFGKATVAWVVSCALLLGGIALVGDPARTAALRDWIRQLTFVLAIWALFPISYIIWPGKPESGPGAHPTAS